MKSILLIIYFWKQWERFGIIEEKLVENISIGYQYNLYFSPKEVLKVFIYFKF